MKLRKLFAGIAAAATLLGGMALGATSAQAVRIADATFTFTAETAEQLTHANLTAYRIGDYYQLSTDCYGVITNDDNKNAVDSALASALGTDAVKTDQDNLAAALSTGALDISATRPWTTTADGAASATRAFANTLESEGKLTNGQQVTLTTPTGSDENGWSATVDLFPGIYVFVDNAIEGTVTKAVPMIVASGTVDAEKKQLVNPNQGDNTVNMKNTKNTEKNKTVDKAYAAIGDTLTYTLTGTVANPAPAAFAFTDTPGVGLTVKAGTYKFYTVGADGDIEAPSTDFTFPKADVTGDGETSFDITVNDPSKYAGQTIKVVFQALVNDEAVVEDGVVNDLDNYGTPIEVTTKFVGFDFKKIDSDNKGIEGAEFQILDGRVALYFVKQDDGSYKKAASKDTEGATDTLVSAADGTVKVTGLDATKAYTVSETKVATGQYLDLKPSFTVNFNNDHEAVLSRTIDPWGLVNTTDKTVKNVKSVDQLPLTGAAGTILFTVMALLLAGAGATVVLKARSKNAKA
ncbi:isopeptide-forming domain-containing fimbrial protein [Bifidobacterium dentium]|uniref:isopeptide-forming domain-containing fimbrial protein n=1 Tax=Bifidobacterium dentium TaxID=1689 RepID=UPI0018B07CC7|nr:isopeptide-forming domain-containing fimbrial protein [Bifidobacterium dentium]MBF9666589.1 isopeptide-forming domain-containing fimbrial protein [Bifidobacterium dentium]